MPGDNVLAVEAISKRGVAGLCAKLSLGYPGKEPVVLFSDRQWKTAAGKAEGWTAVDFDASRWKAAAEIVPMGQSPWGSDANRTPSQSPILRKTMKLADKPIATARLYATALGLYELRINGRRVGDHVLAPDWTDYRKRVRYQVYDVAALAQAGRERPGRPAGQRLVLRPHRQRRLPAVCGKEPALLAQLEVTYADGSAQRIVTRRELESPRQPDPRLRLHAGRIVRRPAGDCRLGRAGAGRRRVAGGHRPRRAAPGPLEGQVMEPVRADWPELQAQVGQRAEAGPLDLRPGPEHGRRGAAEGRGPGRHQAHAAARRDAQSRRHDLYARISAARRRPIPTSARAAATEIWQPRFTFHGFRYVELTGLPGKPGRWTP